MAGKYVSTHISTQDRVGWPNFVYVMTAGRERRSGKRIKIERNERRRMFIPCRQAVVAKQIMRQYAEGVRGRESKE